LIRFTVGCADLPAVCVTFGWFCRVTCPRVRLVHHTAVTDVTTVIRCPFYRFTAVAVTHVAALLRLFTACGLAFSRLHCVYRCTTFCRLYVWLPYPLFTFPVPTVTYRCRSLLRYRYVPLFTCLHVYLLITYHVRLPARSVPLDYRLVCVAVTTAVGFVCSLPVTFCRCCRTVTPACHGYVCTFLRCFPLHPRAARFAHVVPCVLLRTRYGAVVYCYCRWSVPFPVTPFLRVTVDVFVTVTFRLPF